MQDGGAENQPSVSPDQLPLKLPAWEETFLAKYSRNTKMAALTLLVFICASPWLFAGHGVDKHAKPKPTATVQRVDASAGLPNPIIAPKGEGQMRALNAGPSPFINEQDDHATKLTNAPDVALTEDTADGSLPRIGLDGREPWQVYARPFNTADTRPRIALVITGLGLSRLQTDAAVDRLPVNVTLAFDVEGRVTGAWCARARQAGHETLLQVPMEPFDYPRSDPGGNTLLTTLPNTDNIERLNRALREASGYVGIMTVTGSRFTTDPEKMDLVADILKHRGLMIVDARVAPHSVVPDVMRIKTVPFAVSTEQLDQNLAPEAIDAALDQLEKTARLTGHAVGITAAEPVMIDRLENWLKGLPSRGIALAPVSAVTQ